MNSKKSATKPAKSASGKINLKAPVKATTKASPHRLSTNHNETLLIA